MCVKFSSEVTVFKTELQNFKTFFSPCEIFGYHVHLQNKVVCSSNIFFAFLYLIILHNYH